MNLLTFRLLLGHAAPHEQGASAGSAATLADVAAITDAAIANVLIVVLRGRQGCWTVVFVLHLKQTTPSMHSDNFIQR